MKTPAEMMPPEIDAILSDLMRKEDHQVSTIMIVNDTERDYKKANPPRVLSEYDRMRRKEAQVKLLAIQAQAEPYREQYRLRQWKRYFLVMNGNGHVHRERTCTTCFPTTVYGWLTELSGCDEKAAVEEHGEKMCTICFPDAPSLYKLMKGPSRQAQVIAAKRAEREAKRQAKEAKRIANAITDLDGKPLKGVHWVRNTVMSAKIELNDTARYINYGNFRDDKLKQEYLDAFERLAKALGAKLGQDPEVLKATALKKTKKR